MPGISRTRSLVVILRRFPKRSSLKNRFPDIFSIRQLSFDVGLDVIKRLSHVVDEGSIEEYFLHTPSSARQKVDWCGIISRFDIGFFAILGFGHRNIARESKTFAVNIGVIFRGKIKLVGTVGVFGNGAMHRLTAKL